MTREGALLGLYKCKQSNDIEASHVDADDILCELLIELGYNDVVSAYNKVPKWFA